MKFRPIYLYGLLFIALITFLILISGQSNNTTITDPGITENMPEDDIHSNLQNQANTGPNKNNVSEQYRQQLNDLTDAVEKNPKDTLKLRELADFLTASHKTDEAISYYERIIDIDSKRKDILFSLSYLYFTKNNLTVAEDLNKKVLAFDADDEMALYNLGAINATRGEKDKAREYWNKVIRLSPDSETGKLASEALLKL